MADLSKVTITPEDMGITATCEHCGGHRRFRFEHVNLAEIIDAMTDHLERNHPEPSSS